MFRSMTKGRVAIFLDGDQQPYIENTCDFGFQQHGMDLEGYWEVNADGLDLWKRCLVLPDGHELVRVYYGMNTHKWQLILASEMIPRVYRDLDIDEAKATVEIIPQNHRQKTIRITHLELPEFLDSKYQRGDGTVRCLMHDGSQSYVPCKDIFNLQEKGIVKQVRPHPPEKVK